MKATFVDLATREKLDIDTELVMWEKWHLDENIIFKGYLYQISDIRRDLDNNNTRFILTKIGVPKD